MATKGSSRNPRRQLGDSGEALAVQRLEAAGLTILIRNWRCPAGEIDIVAQEPAPDFTHGGVVVPWLVLVEVRTRRGDRFGTALQSLTPRKQSKLRELAGCYIQTHTWLGPWRIDLVAIQMDRQGRLLAIDHIRHAVTG
jgi:putative endonuclease